MNQGAMMLCAAASLVLPSPSPAQQIAIGGYGIPTADSSPFGITTGPDGALWFTEYYGNKIGRITTSGTVTEYALPEANSNPNWIAVGSDGALWFTESTANKIGRITTAGAITEYAVPTANSFPQGIAAGPDGALWFAESDVSANMIGRITTAGVFTGYPVPTAQSRPTGIAAGPDGSLWFTENAGGNIGRITTAGAITEYPLSSVENDPAAIVAGPDGAIWFTETRFANIGRITTAGQITEYPVIAGSFPSGITPGPDGALWFTVSNNIGRITTAGVITEYTVPGGGFPFGIVTGPDSELWFADEDGNNFIGEVFFVTAGMSVSPPTANYRTKLAFTGTGFAPGESVLIYTSGVGSDILARATADTAGAFTADAREPESPFGPRMFLGVGRRSGKLGAANLSVTTRLILQPTSGPPGSTVSVQGYGFASDEELSINWNESTRLGRVAANVHGTFNGAGSVTFTVPAGAAPGIYTVTAKGAIPRLRGVASFTVE